MQQGKKKKTHRLIRNHLLIELVDMDLFLAMRRSE